jgi:hypothetical protein
MFVEAFANTNRTHHRDNRRFGDEVAWWSRQAIDPVGTSRLLWVSTRRIE